MQISPVSRLRVHESIFHIFILVYSKGKSQQEVNTLKEELAALRASRNNFSQAVLQEAKSRLEILHRSLNVPDPFAHAHTARLLESLVADNEALKKDVSELNMLLDEARDELQETRERWDEETRVHNLVGLILFKHVFNACNLNTTSFFFFAG